MQLEKIQMNQNLLKGIMSYLFQERKSFLLISHNVYKLKYFSEISRDTETTFKKLLKEASKAPAPKQIGIGAACGWVSGYVMMKVGKAAATAVGGSLILLQIAHYKGQL